MKLIEVRYIDDDGSPIQTTVMPVHDSVFGDQALMKDLTVRTAVLANSARERFAEEESRPKKESRRRKRERAEGA